MITVGKDDNKYRTTLRINIYQSETGNRREHINKVPNRHRNQRENRLYDICSVGIFDPDKS